MMTNHEGEEQRVECLTPCGLECHELVRGDHAVILVPTPGNLVMPQRRVAILLDSSRPEKSAHELDLVPL
jgi:hypothetical protein